jgi:transglutaminase-like putative cysteine protease
MNRPSPIVLALSALLAIFALASLAIHAAAGDASSVAASRTLEFSYQVHFPASPDLAGPVNVWIPSPTRLDSHQTVSNLAITGDVKHSAGHENEYRDDFIVLHPTAAQVASGFDAGIRFTVTRREDVVLRDGTPATKAAVARVSAPVLQRYLEPDKMVPLNGVIADLGKQQTAGATTQMEKARKIYDYVVSTMHYDKSGEGWGRGDAVWACDSKRGNCTDFHSVLIGMMRSSGIPARFEIGFPLPEGKTEGDIAGYHCWAEFYIDGIGWIPVDASEASKNPAKKEYFFGALDANRVLFSYGRDIRLSPEQNGAPLNYFIYPYAEANGQPIKNLQTHFSFREVAGGEKSASLR